MVATVWYMLDQPPPPGSYAGPIHTWRTRGKKIEFYRNLLRLEETYILVERPAIGQPQWLVAMDPHPW